MTWLFIIVALIYGSIILFELYLIAHFRINPKWKQEKEREVSIMICARDEAHNLPRILDSIIALDYPKDKLQVIVGDDNSEDATWKIIEEYESRFDFIQGVEIQEEKEGLIAKGNVLHQLTSRAEHEFQLIIDADMQVSPEWLHAMIEGLEQNDLISGYTQVAQQGAHHWVQFFDWQIVLHSMKSMADNFRPISILGNNMGFRKRAYDRVGGFLALGPTDVEDLALLQLFQQKGHKTAQLIFEQGEALTQPQANLKEMITQRCRWMNGVFTHHWILALPAFFARLWLFVGLLMFLWAPYLTLIICAYGLLINHLKFYQISRATRTKAKMKLYEPVFISLLDTFALLRIIILGKVEWKGRKF